MIQYSSSRINKGLSNSINLRLSQDSKETLFFIVRLIKKNFFVDKKNSAF